MLAHTPILYKWGLTGLLHISSKLLSPRSCAAHSEYITSADAAPQRSLPDATQINFFLQNFGIRCRSKKHYTNYLMTYAFTGVSQADGVVLNLLLVSCRVAEESQDLHSSSESSQMKLCHVAVS
jgi:hypothetical protein